MLKTWEIGCPDRTLSAKLCQQGGISSLCADVLISHGILSVEAAEALLSADALSDPFLLKGMQEAADRINAAIETGERICVYGDYDCDGVTATVMLVSWLTVAGADVIWYIPTRAEGYGMRCDRIQKLHDEEHVSLIVTVDNGISAVEEAKLIRELGMSLVITDHHRPGDVIPEAEAVVDPYQPGCPSPYKTICGAVVVLKLLAAMDGGDSEPVMEQFGDLAALATIADVMPIDGENRFLVKRGLDFLANTEHVGLLALMAVSGIEMGTAISATAAAFQLIPRINAAGRFGDAALAAKLFLTDDPEEAESLAQEIHNLNTERRETEQTILQEIMEDIRQHPEALWQRVLVFSGESWHHGVIGIVAARLQERFGKPCFLMTRDGDCYRGSARGFGAFSVFECLHSCESLLVKYGGHPGAGGFTVTAENKDAFCAAIQAYALRENAEMPIMTVSAVRAVSPQELNIQNVKGLEILEPFGHGNEKPLFALLGMTVCDVISLKDGAHTKFRLRQGNSQLDALLFRMSPAETGITPGMTLDFLVSCEVRSYMGRDTLSVRVEDWRQSERVQKQTQAAQLAYEAFRRGEKLPSLVYYQRLCPRREDLVAVYQIVRKAPCTIAQICEALQPIGMNNGRARICAAVFNELELVQFDVVTDTVTALPNPAKRELTDSALYKRITEKASGAS